MVEAVSDYTLLALPYTDWLAVGLKGASEMSIKIKPDKPACQNCIHAVRWQDMFDQHPKVAVCYKHMCVVAEWPYTEPCNLFCRKRNTKKVRNCDNCLNGAKKDTPESDCADCTDYSDFTKYVNWEPKEPTK
jgi:hypothetical protein